MRPRKYLKGEKINSAGEVAIAIQQNSWLYLHDRPKHPGWIASMQFRCIIYHINNGNIHHATVNPEYEERSPKCPKK